MVSEPLHRHDLRHGDGRALWLYGPHDGSPLSDSPPSEQPRVHLRHDSLTDTWVAISPARNTRPQAVGAGADERPTCPLCPGGPEVPFPFAAAVFENRWPTLVPDPPLPPQLEGPTAPARGRCEVVLYTPTHEGSLATLTGRELANVVAIWTDRTRELWSDPSIRYVLPFENRGEDVGATLPHPHGQIYALDHLPLGARIRLDALTTHRRRTDECLTCGVVARDDAAPARIIAPNRSFTVAVPFAPNWPFEIHVRARRHGARRLVDLRADERHDLAAALRTVVRIYDRLHARPMAYLMVAQEAPDQVAGHPAQDWHLSFEFLPPQRSAEQLKIRASVETAAAFFINDTLPESSAAALAAVPTGSIDDPDDPIPDVEVVAATSSVGEATPSGRHVR